MNIYVKYITA